MKALVQLFADITEDEARLHILKALTQDASGRAALSETLALRLEDRIEEARRAARGVRVLLNGLDVKEKDLQRFFTQHPWLIGLDYVSIRPKTDYRRGSWTSSWNVYDGFRDLFELKSPGDPIIVSKAATEQSTFGTSSSQFAQSRESRAV